MKKLLIIFIILNSLYAYSQTNDNNESVNTKKKIVIASFEIDYSIKTVNSQFYENVFSNLSKILINELSNEEYNNFIIVDKDIENYRYDEVNYQIDNLNRDKANSFNIPYNADYIIFNKILKSPTNEYFIISKMINIVNNQIFLSKRERIEDFEIFTSDPNIILQKIKSLAKKISLDLQNK